VHLDEIAAVKEEELLARGGGVGLHVLHQRRKVAKVGVELRRVRVPKHPPMHCTRPSTAIKHF
jgi:hypothetical protein